MANTTTFNAFQQIKVVMKVRIKIGSVANGLVNLSNEMLSSATR